MKTYTYEKRYFVIEVLITGIISVAAVVLCPIIALQGFYPPIMGMLAIVGFYQTWNTFVAIANPETVTIDDETISFSAWGRTDSYRLDELTEFRVREFPSAGKMYLRINKHTIFKGRYWLQTKQFTDGAELFRRVCDMEYQLHPDSLKATARRVNTAYMEAEEQGQIKPARATRKKGKKK